MLSARLKMYYNDDDDDDNDNENSNNNSFNEHYNNIISMS